MNARSFCLGLFLVLFVFSPLSAQTDKVTTTPALLQQGFGPGGSLLPGDGENYCAPTSSANSALWLYNNGYTRLYEEPFAASADNEVNLVRALAGLMGTEAQGGTGGDQIASGWSTYLNLKGYGGFDVISYDAGDNISYADYGLGLLQSENTGYNVVNFAFYWGVVRDGVESLAGGHATTLLQSDPLNNEVTINNPAPFTAGDNPETFSVQRIDFLGETDVLAVDFSSQNNGNPLWGLAAFSTVISPDVLPGDSGTPTTWTITGDQEINTNGSYLTVEAPITGAGRLVKTDKGDANGILVLQEGVGGLADPYTFTGGLLVQSGTLIVREDGVNPVGTGNVEILDGFLDFSPAGSGQNLSLTLAGGAGETFTYTGGGGLVIDKGDHLSVELTIGGNTDGATANFIRGEQGALMLLPAAGIAELGQSERILVAGSGGNLPAMTNGIVNPHLVAADPTQSYDGSFLAYDATRGFEANAGVDSAGTPLASMSSTAVANVTGNQSLAAAKRVYALRIADAVSVDGAGTLSIGAGAANGAGGLILNGGTLATAETDFGQARGVVYTGSRGGRIESTISTADGVLYYGPGLVTVTGANTYSGGTLVQNGHLQVRNTTGSATGGDTVLVSRDGTLSGDGTVGGNVDMDGIIVPGVFGTTGEVTPAILTVTGDVLFDTDSILSWNLVSLTDDQSGSAGVDWGFLQVGGNLSFAEDSYMRLNFEGIAGPESGNSFWEVNRIWGIASYGTLTNLTNFSIFGSDLQYGDFRLFDDSDSKMIGLEYSPNLGSILAVPEPAAFVLIASLFALGFAGVRRRGRRPDFQQGS